MTQVPTINVVAALIRDQAGRVLLVRKRGTTAFMQPGGKPDAGEDNVSALAREVGEELGCRMIEGSARSLGEFEAAAANEPGFLVKAAVYAIAVCGEIVPRAEIDEMLWIDPGLPPEIQIAPLTRDYILPLAAAGRE
jgi:8-oxo-dGTP diphosphatase